MAEMSKAEIKEYKKAFDMFDRNKDGTINRDELRAIMKELGKDPSEEELKGKTAITDIDECSALSLTNWHWIADMINNVDLDGNETLDFKEFLEMMKYQNVSLSWTS